jgi:multiple sugar transport system substrate-binding protein
VVQPEAWKFLKFLLSEEMQLSSEMMGYPVHKKAATLRLEKERATFEKENEGAASAEKMDAHVKMIQGMLDKAVVTSSGDIRLTMLIMKDFDSYMDGQKSLDEVSKLIQNRAITYLNE